MDTRVLCLCFPLDHHVMIVSGSGSGPGPPGSWAIKGDIDLILYDWNVAGSVPLVVLIGGGHQFRLYFMASGRRSDG